jgi:glutathione S-transferase
MKLYYAPGACSIGIHVLLEEIGQPYELAKLSLQDGDQRKPEFLQINPKGKVPTLVRDDGTVLTEFPAIAWWLALMHPDSGLLPRNPDGQARALELMDYVVGTIHGQAFGRILRPALFAPSESDHEQVKARGREMFEGGLKLVDQMITGKDYALGQFSIADAALFYVEFWAAGRMQIPLPPNCAAHYQRMTSRPAVQRVLKDEGFIS